MKIGNRHQAIGNSWVFKRLARTSLTVTARESKNTGSAVYYSRSSNPSENRIASRIVVKTAAGTIPTNARNPSFGTVARLSRLMAELAFTPQSGPMTTSVGIPRMVLVIGATVTL